MPYNAPKIGDRVLITDLTEPPLTFTVAEVLAFDAGHKAWQIGVQVGRQDPSRIFSTDTTLWVRQKSQPLWQAPIAERHPWELYDINSPLAAEVRP